MNLIIDIGNTLVKVAIAEGDTILFCDKYSDITTEILETYFSRYTINHTIISDVRGDEMSLHKWLKQHCHLLPFSHQTALPIAIQYGEPSTLGLDRIAAAVATWKLAPQQPSLSLLLGTCLVANYVSAEGVFLGGSIAPGVTMRLQAMHHFTKKLPSINILEPSPILGESTKGSMMSGAVNGMLFEIEGIINYYHLENNKVQTFVSGGDLFLFEESIKNSIFATPNLVLIGLNEILNWNV